MKSPTIIATVLTVAAIGAAPTAATAAPTHAGCSPLVCGTSGNHNEILVTWSLG